jgi:hypothetical protein
MDPHLRYNEIIGLLLRQARHEFDLRYRCENEKCQRIYGVKKPLINHKNHLVWEIYYELMFEYRHDNPGVLEAYEQEFYPVDKRLDWRLRLPPDPLYTPVPYKPPPPPTDEEVAKAKGKPKEEFNMVIEDMSPPEDSEEESFVTQILDEKPDPNIATPEQTREMLIEMAAMEFISNQPPDAQLKWFNDDTTLRDRFLKALSDHETEDPYNQFPDYTLPKDIVDRFKVLKGYPLD